MSRPLRLLPLLVIALMLLVVAWTARAAPPPGIDWEESLAKALAVAKEKGKPVMICINATRVAGKSWRLEPAAKELREKTYRHEDVIELSKEFCCVFISSTGTAEDFGELRAHFQIDGDIVSPQHVFAYPDGNLLYRKEYWPYGEGQDAVDALLKMMNDALAKHHARAGTSPESDETVTPGDGETPEGDDTSVPRDVPPEDPEGRAKWIEAQLALLDSTDEIKRRNALDNLIEADVDGDTLTRVLELLDTYKKQPVILCDVVRELGRPGLEVAVKPLCSLLSHRETTVRAHAAVSLEFIGSKEAVKSLSARAGREKDRATANHVYRALGRCGAHDAKVRARLLKAIKGAGSEFESYGPIIGLAYFEKCEKTARALEKVIKSVGMPSGGRGGWSGGGRRSLLAWCLSEVGFGDPKAAAFVTEEILPRIGEGRWSRSRREFYVAVRDVCNGDEEARITVENGAKRALSGGGAGGRFGGRGSGEPSLTDDARLRRDHIPFAPKGEFGPVGG
jgi:hypothetical protein